MDSIEDSSLESLHYLDSEELSSRLCGSHLHATIENGDFKAFEKLLLGGAPMEVKNCHGLTPLQVVCARQNVDMVTALLRAGCQVNARSSIAGKTALALAAFVGNMDIFEMLINHGADIDLVDNHNWTILHEAILGQSIEILQYTMKVRPAMKFIPNRDGRTPLHLAAFCNASLAVLKVLLKPEDTMNLAKYKDCNGRSINQMAALHSEHDWGAILCEEEEEEVTPTELKMSET